MGYIEIARGFLSRLARDVRGNTVAIMAAALIPLAGLIGGGVDMSRLYLTKTRLQHACDAGALAGRKAMGAGSWTTGNSSTNDKAEKMFVANFASGEYGSGSLTKAFTESGGTVTGTASATIPMTIMKVFGVRSRQVSVNCTAKMELPNTDVMFVLDVTYSMQCAPAATSDLCSVAATGSRRIDGLQKAVKCFYEALMKVATSEPCTYSGGSWSSTGDPVATTATTTAQVRMGFVPYGVNVNVGKILPNSVMADNWTYQTREPVIGSEYSWTLGSASTPTWGSWTSPTSVYTATNYNSFSTVSGADTATTTMNDGRVLAKVNTSATNSTACAALNIYNSQMTGITDSATGTTGSTTYSPTDQNPPVYPATVQNNSTSRTRSNTLSLGYKYTWTSSKCYLQSASKQSWFSSSYTQTQTGSATKPITWTEATNVVTGWTYKAKSLNVSGLKAGGSSWNGTVALSNLAVAGTGSSLTFSGETSARQAQGATSATVTWDGCIEEAHTVQNTDMDPSDEWATLPTDAYDMNVNLIPSSGTAYNSFWGPMLAKTGSTNTSVYGAVWARYTGGSTSWTTSNVALSGYSNVISGLDQDNYTYMCTTSAARKLAEYRTSSDFVTYVNSLAANDLGTYHDIGLLWGGRLVSPLGIFASSNATASSGGAIQRHLIFMTDGNTRTVYNNYDAYGLGFFNRYKTSYDPVCPGASPYTCTYTDSLVNARLTNICNQIKNMKIQLWVISYGSAVNTATENRLKACATDNDHFASAADTSTLTTKFQNIAARISELRLTS